jgi:hypothetical protein
VSPVALTLLQSRRIDVSLDWDDYAATLASFIRHPCSFSSTSMSLLS